MDSFALGLVLMTLDALGRVSLGIQRHRMDRGAGPGEPHEQEETTHGQDTAPLSACEPEEKRRKRDLSHSTSRKKLLHECFRNRRARVEKSDYA